MRNWRGTLEAYSKGKVLGGDKEGFITILWRGADVHAIYCMTASHISINLLLKVGNDRRGNEAETLCVLVHLSKKKGERKGRTSQKQLQKISTNHSSHGETHRGA